MITSDGFGDEDRSVTLGKSIATRGNLEIMGNANLLLSTTATACDVTVGGNLVFLYSDQAGTGGSELRYGNTGNARTVTVKGDIQMGKPSRSNNQMRLGVGAANGTPVVHVLNLYGNFVQNNTTTTGDYGLRLGSVQTNDYIQLNLLGDQNTTFNSVSGPPLADCSYECE